MPSLIKAVIFLLMMGALLVLGVLLLPLLIVLYLFLPKRSASAWFNTFSQQQQERDTPDETETEEEYYNQIPASQDIIDVKAEEIEEKESK